MKWRRGLAAIFLVAGLATGSISVAETIPIHLQRSAEAMGTAFTIDMYGHDRAGMEQAAQQAFEEAHRLDRMLSNYIPDSELNRVNANAANAPVKISPELVHLLTICIEDSRASEGTFDITVGPLMKVWGFYKDSGHLADEASVRKALQSVGWRYLTLNPTASTVSFEKRGMNLDMGGVGKGYAVDRMVQILRQRGVSTGALISAGGSSIYGLGAPPTEPRGWRLRIRDPKSESKHVAEVYLKDNSLSTSGSYEKFFWADGRVYSHIMDPRTGFPSRGMLSVSIVAPKTLDSEIWAKPYYILGRAWTEQHKPRDVRVLLCADRAGATCSWLK